MQSLLKTMRKTCFVLIVLALFFAGCKTENARNKQIEAIDVSVTIDRFDQKFASVTPENLHQLKKEYPYLFPAQYADSVWIAKVTDTLQQELHSEVNKAFPDADFINKELTLFYKHVLYYFPETQVPKIITITNNVDYQQKVLLADSLLFISLDTYLGEDHKFYGGIQKYIRKNLRPELIVSDVASEFATNKISPAQDRTFLSHMIYYGKELYLKDLLLPFKQESDRIGYTKQELEWAKANESEIWRYFVERELLFDTDSKLLARFVYPAPFSKFYLAIDNESPGMIGKFIGWQIVRSFMDKNDVSVEKMLKMPAEEIFKNANYKPSK